ncbi:glycosyltransferase family 2 protein [Flavobacterium cellulosilyticum]|uniref:Glycosyltransferase family 2 protein n=1 Tax=Flavobacterium cellulosilyticum TaxID=2541731 RepID=A0A4R5CH34_9FLAO|nr:glycosyltransferase family 2 protein [Flavobacterium cellulosilyticum]TDD98356.1 glycosyltransferase family 2 protein [Flavobacterium cellulosilyticum]
MVSIIIVNYNTKKITIDCLESIKKFTTGLEYEIIVVDNASADGSQEALKRLFPDVKLIESPDNRGFGLANNLGVRSAMGEFVFLLNSDTVLVENSIKIMLDFFQKYQHKLNIGAIGTVLIDEANQTNGFGSHFPSCKEENAINLKKIPLIGQLISFSKNHQYDIKKEYFEIDYIIGADLLMRKDFFEKLDGFSKEFFMYYEESDLQKRMDNLGFKRYITTNTKIIHLEDGSGKSIKKYSNRKRTIVHKSKNIYLKRNDKENFSKYAILDFIILFLNFFNFKYSFKENFNYFKEILSTY